MANVKTLNTRRLGKTGYSVSSVGFGSYRIHEDSPVHLASLRQALLSGCSLIDTSTNYGDGSSEKAIGQVLRELIQAGQLRRSDVFLVTKVGYVQGDNLIAAQAQEHKGRPYPEMVKYQDGCWHCLSPSFLSDQIDASLKRLGVSKIDSLLLHNPEYFLKAGGNHSEYYDRIERAFKYLETEVSQGRIGSYGVSSNTLTDSKDSPEYTSLETLIECAKKVGDGSHFAIIQFPLNLFEPGAVFVNNNSGKSVLELAQIHDLGVLINRPLNAFTQGRLIRLASFDAHTDRDCVKEFEAALTKAMAHEASYKAQDLIPIREIAWAHILRQNIERLGELDRWRSALEYQFEPSVRAATARLLETEHADWTRQYFDLSIGLFTSFTLYLEARAHLTSQTLIESLDQAVPALKTSPTLSSKVIRIYQSLPGVSCVLVGMRRPEYVRDCMLQSESLTAEQAMEAFDAVPWNLIEAQTGSMNA